IIPVLRERGIKVAAGHCAPSFQQVCEAIDLGLTHVTHAFNGMAPLHHRDPGIVGALLTRDELTTEAIVDGLHLHPAIVQLLYRCKGMDKLALVTDATMAADMADGNYSLGDLEIQLRNGEVRLPDGTLAGSALTMDRAVTNAARFLGLPICQAVHMATMVPARIIGVEGRKGSLEPGKDADIVILDQDGRVDATIVAGQVVYAA
ncbi:MAG TPA: amidohydrolase family protein, partial [Firmicutes bacterium]|nr:amidohydrolase family protein [Bacillota bacterium]